jgi:hypothetical protein
MTDPNVLVAVSSAGIGGICIASAAVLKGWSGWLDLKRMELGGTLRGDASSSPAARIEMADLKERVRKLEAIASGVDL